MEQFFTFDAVQSGAILLILLVIGDYISKKLRGRIPAVLVAGLIFMLISWTGALPGNLMESGGFSGLVTIGTSLIIVNLGASMSIRTFIANWKVAALAMSTYILVSLAVVGALSLFLGFNTAAGALPGGAMTAMIIQQRGAEIGCDDAVVLSVLYFSTKTIIATILANRHIRREAKRLLSLPADQQGASQSPSPVAKPLPLFDRSGYGNLCKLYLVSWLASRAAALTGVNVYLLCMIFGVLGAQVGFVDKRTLGGSGAEKFFMFLMMANIVSGFGKATPSMLTQMVVPLVTAYVIEIAVLYIVPTLLGKLLGFSRDMALALGTNVMMGFPLNMMISTEIAESMTEDPEERKYLGDQIASKMVIAGLSTTTSLAVFAAALVAGWMG